MLDNLENDNGGEEGIRTLDTFYRIHDFQSCAFNRSATSPNISAEYLILPLTARDSLKLRVAF